MSRSVTAVRGLLVTALVVALAGCTQAPEAATTEGCGGMISKVLLADDSATKVATFSAADVPQVFAIPATPAPTCYYSATSTPPASDGVNYTLTHRTLVYIGLSDADAAALIAGIRKTVSVAPWTVFFDDGVVPAAPASPAPTSPAPTAAAASVSVSARWNYNFAGGSQDDKGQLGYYAALPVSNGTAAHAGLPTAQNVVRIEAELRQVKK